MLVSFSVKQGVKKEVNVEFYQAGWIDLQNGVMLD